MKARLRTLALAALVSVSLPSHAVDTVVVTNAAQLTWFYDSSSGKVYFRNLDQFNANFLGCCFNWYIDTSTTVGRTLWASILLKMAGAQPINLIVGAMNTAGPVLYAGNW
jgi:hypothetical protein